MIKINPKTLEAREEFTLDSKSVVLLFDSDRAIAAGFVFLKGDWLVTAKHVVFDEVGNCKRGLRALSAVDNKFHTLTYLWSHETLDVVLFRIHWSADGTCSKPLLPSYEDVQRQHGLVAIGYCPSKSMDKKHALVVRHIDSYKSETRNRRDGAELTFVFKGEGMEGGCSGGPLLGIGGSIVGLITQFYCEAETSETSARAEYGRGTSVQSILDALLTFAEEGMISNRSSLGV